MKSTLAYILLFLAAPYCLGGCSDAAATDTDIAIIVDKTDRMTSYPNANEIISQLGLQDNPWGIRITATYISDRDINDVTILNLEGESQWNGNKIIRKAKIEHFRQKLQQCLTAMRYNGTCPYSIVYRTVARQANRLAASTANRRLLLVYSDLYENNTELNFYDPHVINRLRKNPQSVAVQLEATVPLKRLSGLQLWLLYNPVSLSQNNHYMTVANLYQGHNRLEQFDRAADQEKVRLATGNIVPASAFLDPEWKKEIEEDLEQAWAFERDYEAEFLNDFEDQPASHGENEIEDGFDLER